MRVAFIDVDTQLDFLTAAGALAVPGAAKIAPAITALTRHALAAQISIVSTVDSHVENDVEFQTWKPHCVIGTQGHAKFAGSLAAKTITIGDEPNAVEHCIPAIRSVQQVIVAKHTIDVFASRNLRRVIEVLAADHYVVYGLVTEYCVRAAVLYLLPYGRVELVVDAVKELDWAGRESTLNTFLERGGRLTDVGKVLGGQLAA